jgi:hypothetical protein
MSRQIAVVYTLNAASDGTFAATRITPLYCSDGTNWSPFSHFCEALLDRFLIVPGSAPSDSHRFLLFDHDSKFGNDVVSCAKDMGSEPVRTAFRSPWQNGVAERWVGSCRRDLLDHVIVLNERHLKRLMSEYVRYYHEDRTHLGLAKDAPTGRPVAIRSAGNRIQSFSRLGGLHHRYVVVA